MFSAWLITVLFLLVENSEQRSQENYADFLRSDYDSNSNKHVLPNKQKPPDNPSFSQQKSDNGKGGKGVNCGSHRAKECSQCGNLPAKCNADCHWQEGKCRNRNLHLQTGGVNCGGHRAQDCLLCGNKPGYCNADCHWHDGKCKNKNKQKGQQRNPGNAGQKNPGQQNNSGKQQNYKQGQKNPGQQNNNGQQKNSGQPDKGGQQNSGQKRNKGKKNPKQVINAKRKNPGQPDNVGQKNSGQKKIVGQRTDEGQRNVIDKLKNLEQKNEGQQKEELRERGSLGTSEGTDGNAGGTLDKNTGGSYGTGDEGESTESTDGTDGGTGDKNAGGTDGNTNGGTGDQGKGTEGTDGTDGGTGDKNTGGTDGSTKGDTGDQADKCTPGWKYQKKCNYCEHTKKDKKAEIYCCQKTKDCSKVKNEIMKKMCMLPKIMCNNANGSLAHAVARRMDDDVARRMDDESEEGKGYEDNDDQGYKEEGKGDEEQGSGSSENNNKCDSKWQYEVKCDYCENTKKDPEDKLYCCHKIKDCSKIKDKLKRSVCELPNIMCKHTNGTLAHGVVRITKAENHKNSKDNEDANDDGYKEIQFASTETENLENTERPEGSGKTNGTESLETTEEPESLENTTFLNLNVSTESLENTEEPAILENTEEPANLEITEEPASLETTDGPASLETSEGPAYLETTEGSESSENGGDDKKCESDWVYKKKCKYCENKKKNKKDKLYCCKKTNDCSKVKHKIAKMNCKLPKIMCKYINGTLEHAVMRGKSLGIGKRAKKSNVEILK